MIEYDKKSYLYGGTYNNPNDLWTPEEITEAGFIFTPDYIINQGEQRIVLRTYRFCGAGYQKKNEFEERWRGIESVSDYCDKKDIFKPQILEWMKREKFHYVHRVSLEDGLILWHGKYACQDTIFHRHAVSVRAYRIPTK